MIAFTNQAALSYNGIIKNSNIVSGSITETLSAAKTAVNSNYSMDGTVTYVISITNSGAVPYTNLTVTDNLGQTTVGNTTVYPLAYVNGTLKYYVNGVLQAAPAVQNEQTLTISGITVPANGSILLIYNGTTNEYTPLDTESSITNTVTVTGDSLSAPITASETVNAAAELNLSIIKSLSPTEVSENGTLTYTFTIENYGNKAALAADSLTVTDVFTPKLGSINVTFNSAAWAEGTNYTYNEASGEFATVVGQITVPKATFTQNAETGVWTITPGISTVTVTGTV